MRSIRLVMALAVVLAGAAGATTLPTGFTETSVGGLTSPTAMAVSPDGRVFVCEQGGKLRVVKNGALLSTPFVTLTVDSNGERGLLGVALDPNFVTNQFVYVYYTVPGSPPHNRMSRFTANGDVAAAGSELPLLDLNNLSSATNHNGGALHFGLDGKLYIAVGENANSSNSQTLGNLLGKLLRLNSNGTIPPDNPFVGVPGARGEIWALGLRNPFSFSSQPFTGRIFINDVGQDVWEEIDDGFAGLNYGWPNCEGLCTPTNPLYTDPFYTYQHAAGTCAITGGDFYNPQNPQFPAEYVGDYFFADYCAGWIKRIDTATKVVTDFAIGGSSLFPVDVHVDDYGNLYYLTRGAGSLRKVTYTGSNSPTITQDPESQLISVGHSVTFTVAASGAPPLTYQWQRDSVDIPLANSPDYTIASVTLADGGHQFRCVVSNAFAPPATSAQATLSVTSNQPPVATIATPVPGTLYAGGDTIAFSGSGSDPELGPLPASALTWWVNFHHDTHFHPFLPPTSGITSGSFTIPVLGETSPNVWYRIHLQVVDSVGLTSETYRDVLPKTSTMSFATNPSGLQLTVDGQPFTAPMDIVGVVGIVRTIGAPSPQGANTFLSWSDGGAKTHTISTPAADTTYTALFTGGEPAVSAIHPTSGPASGGTGATISGSNFVTGATVKIGGVAATGVSVPDSAHVEVTVPALEPGTLNDVTVTNPGLLGDTLTEGWFADFVDVPQASPYHGDVEKVFRDGITVGCTGGDYCAGQPVKRSEMAVFLLKSKYGSGHSPAACAGLFEDVVCGGPTPGFAVDFIEELYLSGITGGCGVPGGPLLYCPDRSTTRAEMAVLLLRTQGVSAPEPCTGVFQDVACGGASPGFAVDWIESLFLQGVTAGCGPVGGPLLYCPDLATPRDQMATFLVRTFALP